MTTVGEALVSGSQAKHPEPPKWKDLPPMDQERQYHAAVRLDEHRLLVVGGTDENDKCLSSTEVYDSRTNQWESGPELNEGRYKFAAAVCNNKVYVLGGYNYGKGSLDSIECLDLNQKPLHWTTMDVTLSSKRQGATAAAIGTEVYVLGGNDGESYKSVDILDMTTGTVRKGTSMRWGRYGCAAGVVGTIVYVVGGEDDDGRNLYTIEYLDVRKDSGEWHRCDAILSTARIFPAVAVVHHCLVIIGGYDGRNTDTLSSVEVFDTRRHVCWKLKTDMSHGRWACAALTLGESNVMVVGGSGTCYGTPPHVSMEVINMHYMMQYMEFDANEARLSGFPVDPVPKWSTENFPPMNHNRNAHAAVRLDEHRILLIGGGNEGTGNHLSLTEIYDSRNNEWLEGPELNKKRYSRAAAFCNDKVYVFGGSNEKGKLKSIECLDLSMEPLQWMTMSLTLSCAQSRCTAVVVGTNIYVTGDDADAFPDSSSVTILDKTTGTIHQGPSLTLARGYGCAAGVVGNIVYVVGGMGANGNPLDTIEYLDTRNQDLGKWQKCNATMSTARMFPAVAVFQQWLIISGGSGKYLASLSSVEVFDTQRDVCWRLTDMNQKRASFAAVTLNESQVMVVGGFAHGDSNGSVETLTLTQQEGPLESLNGHDDGDDLDSMEAINLNPAQIPHMHHHLPVYCGGRIVATKRLKRSGQGVVYRGKMSNKNALDREVAIKVYESSDHWDSCKQEVMDLLRISAEGHPNVMDVVNFYEVPQPCFVMRFVTGGDLRDFLNQHGRFIGDDAVRLLSGIGEGLRHLHAHRFVHRDLKPQNILLESTGSSMRPVLIDFGLGKRMEAELDELQVTSAEKGTILWMAPEMLMDRQWNTKTDMYALGIVMWEVLTGKVPYSDKSTWHELAIWNFVLNGGRPDTAELENARVSQAHQDIIVRLWDSDPLSCPSAEDFVVALLSS